jgi:hypothetical protein
MSPVTIEYHPRQLLSGRLTGTLNDGGVADAVVREALGASADTCTSSVSKLCLWAWRWWDERETSHYGIHMARSASC